MFELATKDMTPRQRRDWWIHHAEGNWQLGIRGRGKEDLGPELPSDHKLLKADRQSPMKKDWENDCSDSWYKTGSVTGGLTITLVDEYNNKRG